jgi:hypothetical protein
VSRFTAKRVLQAYVVAAALTLITIGSFVRVNAAGANPNWVQANPTQSPPGRTFAAMAYDSLRARTVLFGGSASTSTNFSDTWEWDGSAWTQAAPALSPPGLVGAAMAYDTVLKRAILFGGATSAGVVSSETWEWDGTTWTLMSPATSPPARLWHAIAYDSKRDRVVLFGGNGGAAGNFGDTWVFDGTTWTKLAPTSSPSARFGEAMAFDSSRNQVVMFGGHDVNGQRVGDTWEWDGTNWTQRSPSSAPFVRFWHSMAFDAQTGTTVLFGGDYFKPGALGPINDTWEWDGSQWIQDLTASAPSPRAGQSMAYDQGRSRIVLFGGTNEVTPQVFYNDTWELVAPDSDLALSGVPSNITANATSSSGAVVTYTSPAAVDEAGDIPAPTVSCVPASGSTFPIGTTTVTCTATSSDDSPSTVSATFTVTVVVDLRLAVSVKPSTATNGTIVTGSISLTNDASVKRVVTGVAKFSFVSPTGQTTTFKTSKFTITLAAGQTVTRSTTFKVSSRIPRGTYEVSVTASDVTGAVSSTATFTVT